MDNNYFNTREPLDAEPRSANENPADPAYGGPGEHSPYRYSAPENYDPAPASGDPAAAPDSGLGAYQTAPSYAQPPYAANAGYPAPDASGYDNTPYETTGVAQSYTAANHTTPQKPQPKSPAKKEKRRFGGGMVVVCVLLSFLCGIGGAFTYSALAGNGSGAAGGTNVPVVYEGAGTTDYQTGNTVADVAALAGDSVVEITTESQATSSFLNEYVTTGAGSGVILTEDGYVVTCAHVVSGESNIKVTLSDGTTYDAALVGSDSVSDIAVLKIEASGLSPAVLGDSDSLIVGEDVIVIGNPLGALGGSVTNGIISALEREVTVSSQTMTLLQTNAAINPGNSGGGMFNEKGELIGIVNAKSAGTGVEGLGFAIPINDVKPVVESIIENGFVVGRPAMGVEVVDINSASAAEQYGVSRYGVLIAGVSEGGAAQRAGIEPGDYLISIDDNAVEAIADITPILEGYEVGETVAVQVIRGTKTLSFEVTLQELGV